jgi:dCTP deaminase
MILSDKSIHAKIASGKIGIEPTPDTGQVQPASLDVRLGREFYKEGMDAPWTNGEEVVLEPGVPYLAHTKESIDLPNDIAAQLTGRSSIGRQGIIVHKTAGWIDPGFKGEITLELLNMGNEEKTLEVGSRVAQMVFFQLDHPSSGYTGQYQNQSGATTHDNA